MTERRVRNRGLEAEERYVLRNRLMPDRLWGEECDAYNVQLWPDDRVLRDLERIQGDLLLVEPDLLACPPHSLHLSVLPLLAVRTEYDLDKAQIWSAEGARWLRGIAAIVRESHAFTIRFDRLVATRSAVIALAARADHVIALREELARNLDLPASSVDQVPSIAHVTLFRYKRPLIDPHRFLAAVSAARATCTWAVREVCVTRELVYPSIEVEILLRSALA